MNVLLIGGGGFLGVQLVKKLTLNEHNVVVFDKFKYHTQDLIKCKKIVGDVGAITLRSDFNYQSFDCIFYLSQSRLDEITTDYQVDTEVKYFKTFLDSLSSFEPKVFFISSCSVYGNSEDIVNENSPVQITSGYSRMKIECENILLEKKNPKFKILRLSTLYGKTQPYRSDVLINGFIDDILESKKIEIYGGESKRPHLHVEDCATILSELVDKDIEEPILNIGFNDLNISKMDIIKKLQKIRNFNYILTENNDPRNYSVNFDLLEKYIIFEPKIFIEEFKTYFI